MRSLKEIEVELTKTDDRVYKTLHHQNPVFLSELFQRREIRYNLEILTQRPKIDQVL